MISKKGAENNDIGIETESGMMQSKGATFPQEVAGNENKLSFESGEETYKDETKDFQIYHGLQLSHSVKVARIYTEILYFQDTEEFLLVSPSNCIARFKYDGTEITPAFSVRHTNFTRLKWAPDLRCFLCWGPELNEFYVAREDFVFMFRGIYDEPVMSLFYDDSVRQVVIAGRTLITRYEFPLGSRQPKQKDSLNITETSCPCYKIDLGIVQRLNDTGVQLLCASSINNVFVVDLESKTIVKNLKAVHMNQITALILYQPLTYFITGDSTGTVKCWDSLWDLVMVFVGHSHAILHLIPHPTQLGFISIGKDNTLQVWSFTLNDRIQTIKLSETILCATVDESHQCIVTVSSEFTVWLMNHVFDFHCALSARTTSLHTAMSPCYPCRSVVLSEDSSVRIVSPISAESLTTQIVSEEFKVRSAAYAGSEELLFSLLEEGDILVSNCLSNPTEFMHIWKKPEGEPKITILVVYENVVKSKVLKSAQPCFGAEAKLQTKYEVDKVILYGGRTDGSIVKINLGTGDIDNIVHGHEGQVFKMIINNEMNQMLTSGFDNAVKVWKVFAYSDEEPTILLMTLYFSVPISHMATLYEVACIAVSTTQTMHHGVIMYNLLDKVRYDHAPSQDHTGQIVGLNACAAIDICASCSEDGTIRIWNDINVLLKLIVINAVPHNLTFCTLRGDILLGIGKHCYKIRYEKYLPPQLHQKIIIYQVRKEVSETSRPTSSVNYANLKDINQLYALIPKASRPVFITARHDEEEKYRKELVQNLRGKAAASLSSRDADIADISEGQKAAKKVIPPRKQVGCKSWKNMIDSVLKEGVQITRPLGDAARINIQAARRKQLKIRRGVNMYELFKARYGKVDQQVYKEKAVIVEKQNLVFSVKGCFVPNSVLLRVIGARSSAEIMSNVPFTDIVEATKLKELAMVQSMLKKYGFKMQDRVAEPSPRRSADNVVELKDPLKHHILKKKTSKIMAAFEATSGFFQQLQTSRYFRVERLHSEGDLSSDSKRSKLPLLPLSGAKECVQYAFGIPMRKVKSDIAMHKVGEIQEERILDESKSSSSQMERQEESILDESESGSSQMESKHLSEEQHSPVGGKTDLESLLSNFAHIKVGYVDVSSETSTSLKLGAVKAEHSLQAEQEKSGNLTKISEREHVHMENLMYLLRTASPDTRMEVLDILTVLFRGGKLKDMNKVKDAVIGFLPFASALPVVFQRVFRFIRDLDILDEDLVSALISLCMMSGDKLRRKVISFLTANGLRDPNGDLLAYLNTWKSEIYDSSSVAGCFRHDKAIVCIKQRLRIWAVSFKEHVDQISRELMQGEVSVVVENTIFRQLEKLAVRSGFSVVPDEEGMFGDEISALDQQQKTGKVDLKDVHQIQSQTIEVDVEENIIGVTLTLKKPPTLFQHESIDPIAALNYGIETQMRRIFAALAQSGKKRRHVESCLTDVRRIPEEIASESMRAHAPWKSRLFLPLPATQPKFHSDEPRGAYPEPYLLTLKTAYKYFELYKSY